MVILMNTNKSFDMLFQMMFRGMSEDLNKKFGFVIDLNIHRAIDLTMDYTALLKPNENPKEALKYLLSENIININPDKWMTHFGNEEYMLKMTTSMIFDIFNEKTP